MKKIALPTRDQRIDDHFGHCEYYTVASIDNDNKISAVQRLDSPQGCGCKSNIAAVLQEMGVTVMIAGNMGDGAYTKLSAHGIEVLRGHHGDINSVLEAYLKGELSDSHIACDHHDCHHHE